MCRWFPRWSPKTGKDEHVWDSFSHLGSSQGRHSWKATKHRSNKGSIRVPDNDDSFALRFLIGEVQPKESRSPNHRNSTSSEASKELFESQAKMIWPLYWMLSHTFLFLMYGASLNSVLLYMTIFLPHLISKALSIEKCGSNRPR